MPVFIASEHGLVSQELFPELTDERATRKKKSASRSFRGLTGSVLIGLDNPLTTPIATISKDRFLGEDRSSQCHSFAAASHFRSTSRCCTPQSL